VRHLRVCRSVCAVCVYTLPHSFIHIRVCVRVSQVDDSLYFKPLLLLCGVCTWQSLEQRRQSCIERT
jgi:hypothetical protein